MLVINEANVLLAVVGSVGVIGSLVVYLYGANRNQKLEMRLAKTRRPVAENTEVNYD